MRYSPDITKTGTVQPPHPESLRASGAPLPPPSALESGAPTPVISYHAAPQVSPSPSYGALAATLGIGLVLGWLLRRR